MQLEGPTVGCVASEGGQLKTGGREEGRREGGRKKGGREEIMNHADRLST